MSNQTLRTPYRFSDNATGNSSSEFGNHILRRGMGEIRKPSWSRTETVVRFLPSWNFESNEWEPYRRSSSPLDYGDWIRRYDAVRGFGDPGITMLLFDPVANPAYNIQTNPCVILYRAINSAIDNRQSQADWPALLKGGAGRRAALSRHSPIYIARVGIFRINSKDMTSSERSPLGLAKDDPCYFLELPKTAGEKLISLLEERNETYEGDPDSPEAYKYGDIVSLDRGAYVHIFEEGADPRPMQQQQAAGPRQLMVTSGGRGNYSGTPTNFKGFDIFIDQNWNGFSALLNSPDLEKLIKSKQRPWEDCLQFYTHQEQAFLVQDGFPSSAILYAWRDHPEWIKDETRSKGVDRTSVAVDPRVQYPQDPPRPNPLIRQPVIVPPAVSSATGKVGGWGDKPASDVSDTGEKKDNVVPPELPDAASVPVDTSNLSREDRAKAALEEARARMANRS